MGTELLDLNFPGHQRMADFVWLHAKYYELYLRCYAVMNYSSAQSRNNISAMAYWRKLLEATPEELLNPRNPIHSDAGFLIADIVHTDSWRETLELVGDVARRAGQLYQRWSKGLKTLMTEGKTGIKNQLTEEAERRFRTDLIQAAKGSVETAREVAEIKDPELRERVSASLSGLMRELDESFGRTKGWLVMRGHARGSANDPYAIDPTNPTPEPNRLTGDSGEPKGALQSKSSREPRQ